MTENLGRKSSSFQKEKHTIELFIHLKVITELIRKEEGETKCICSNMINETQDNENRVFKEEEIVPQLPITTTNDGRILLTEVINQLKLLGYNMTGGLISLYITKAEDYVFIGADPVDPTIVLDPKEVDLTCIRLKTVSYIEEKLVKNTERQLFDKNEVYNKKAKDKRTKERRIGFIVEKVSAWRKLYNGFYNDKGEHTRYSLDDAAKMIDISKKSLDDYLLQLRLGRKYGFDFNKHKNDKVGILRTFVKQNREGIK